MPEELKCEILKGWDVIWKLNGENYTGIAFCCRAIRYKTVSPYFLDPNDAYNYQSLERLSSSELDLQTAHFDNGVLVKYSYEEDN